MDQRTTLENGGKVARVLSGEIKIRCHYFEMGNSQFNLDQKFADVNVKDPNNAASVIETIKKTEDKVSKSIEKS